MPPPYQRNYVRDGEKATYFLESILIGTEIPPLIFFCSGTKVEIIDGRQRYETILRFLRDELKLKKSGLKKLDALDIDKKTFSDLDDDMQNEFLETQLRVIGNLESGIWNQGDRNFYTRFYVPEKCV